MKKICFLVKNIYNQGGDTRAVILLANKMQADYQVEIVSLFKTEDKPSFNINQNIKIVSLFEEPFNLKINYVKVMLKLRKFFKENLIDILIIGAIGFNLIVYPAIILNNKVKIISCEHASYYDGGKIFGLAWFGRLIGCKLMDCVVVLTKKDLSDYINNMGKINRIEQIYNPMDEKLKNSSYNLDSKKLITCGRLVRVKGFDYLIEVAKKIFERYPSWEWHIYGDGPEKKNLEELIFKHNLQNNVKILGEVNNIYDKYSEYAAYIMTSRSESFGMVLVEALKSGIPVVSFDCNNGPREIIIHNENGLLVPTYDVDTMAKEICLLIEDSEFRKKLADNSQNTLNKFEINNIYLQWKNLINSLV